MDAQALARSERATRDALIHIAYGLPLRFNWADAFRFALRDVAREWRGHSASSYGAPYVRELRCRLGLGGLRVIPTFDACRPMLWYLMPVAFIADCVVRVLKILRKARTFNAGVQKTRISARRQIGLEGSV